MHEKGLATCVREKWKRVGGVLVPRRTEGGTDNGGKNRLASFPTNTNHKSRNIRLSSRIIASHGARATAACHLYFSPSVPSPSPPLQLCLFVCSQSRRRTVLEAVSLFNRSPGDLWKFLIPRDAFIQRRHRLVTRIKSPRRYPPTFHARHRSTALSATRNASWKKRVTGVS